MNRSRFGQRAYLKPDKIEEYKQLHAAVWPDVKKTIEACNLHNYSIYRVGNEVISFFEYTGLDYEMDMAKMATDPITQQWWKHTKPCFLRHEEAVYYEDMEEIFHQE